MEEGFVIYIDGKAYWLYAETRDENPIDYLNCYLNI